MARLIDKMRTMLRTKALEKYVPDNPNFRRVRYSGGTENHLGETTGATEDTLDLSAIETTGRGELDDSELTERIVGEQSQGEITLMLLDDLLEKGDRVERIEDGTPYEVVKLEVPRLNDVPVSYNATIREQTD